MTLRARIRRWHSPTLFALVCVCFLLPFATVSCDDAQTTFTGLQLATWTVPEGGVVDEPEYDCTADLSSCVESETSPLADLALAAAILGLTLGVRGVAKGPGWCAATGVVALFLILIQGFDSWADFDVHAGYELALLLSFWAAVVHGQRAVRRRRQGVRLRKAERLAAKLDSTSNC